MGNSSLRDAPRQGAANVTGHGNGNSLESGLNLFCSGEVGGGGLSLPAAGPRLDLTSAMMHILDRCNRGRVQLSSRVIVSYDALRIASHWHLLKCSLFIRRVSSAMTDFFSIVSSKNGICSDVQSRTSFGRR